VSQRRKVVISGDPEIARLEILAHIVYPHRLPFALNLLRDWQLHYNGETRGAEKWSRLEPKLRRFDDIVRRRLQGAYWHRLWGNSEISPNGHARTIRESARVEIAKLSRKAQESAKEETIIRDHWERVRPVAHLGIAAGEAIQTSLVGDLTSQPGWDPRSAWKSPQFDLRRVAFHLDWSSAAIARAEIYARSADKIGTIPIHVATHFVSGAIFEDSTA